MSKQTKTTAYKPLKIKPRPQYQFRPQWAEILAKFSQKEQTK